MIIWLDFPIWRSIHRIPIGEPGPGGNREHWSTLLSENGPRAAWRLHSRLRRQYRALFAEEPAGGRTLIRFTSRAQVNRWLTTVPASKAP